MIQHIINTEIKTIFNVWWRYESFKLSELSSICIFKVLFVVDIVVVSVRRSVVAFFVVADNDGLFAGFSVDGLNDSIGGIYRC